MRSAIRNLLSLVLLAVSAQVRAQPPGDVDVYQPLSQHVPPGVSGYWAGALGKATPRYFQPIRVELPSSGSVAIYTGRPARPVAMTAPAQFGVAVGQTYRLRISNMPELPGVELYPSVEILDRLHPPSGQAANFPVPVEFTHAEIELALSGRLVTKVVYLEQPQLAAPRDLQKPLSALTLPARKNLLAEADRLGRPMVMIRLGGRLPDIHGNDQAFFGSGAPIAPSKRKRAGNPRSSARTETDSPEVLEEP